MEHRCSHASIERCAEHPDAGVIAGANFIVMPACGAALQAYQIALVPDELQGRVNSAFMIVAISASPSVAC
jgi:hypothetical protein